MTTTIVPWTEQALDDREAVFAALVTKAVRGIVRQINKDLRADTLTAAATPPPEPVMAQAEATTLAMWQIFVETTAFPFVTDTFTASAGLVVEAMAETTGTIIEPITNEFAVDFLSYASNRMVKVGLGVWHGIRAELVEGFAAGESIPQIAARLTQFPEVNESRARTVARTEVISAANGGAYTQMLEYDLGDDVRKEWLATEDDRTRIAHKHADNQTVALTGQFTVDIYNDVAKIGTEEMEFPGDHTATPGNVINCRCTLGFTFEEDEVLIASGDFIEAEHPRDGEGKFAKKAEAFLPDLSQLSENQFKSFVKGLTQTSWDKFSKSQQDAIIKHSGPIPDAGGAMTNKLFGLFAKKGTPAPAKKARPQGGVDNATGKPTKPGKPVMLKNKALFYTTYENGAVVAVKKDSGERIIWNGDTKKMERQKRDANGNWAVSESLTRGALMQKYKDEEGWTTPTGNDFSQTAASAPTPVTTPGKPIKLKVNVLYNQKYADGDIIAVRPDSAERLLWNGKKVERQFQTTDGKWTTSETLTKHQVYDKYKDENGWFTPGDGTPGMQEPEIVAPEPSQPVLPAPEPAVEVPAPVKTKTKAAVTLDPATGKFTKPVTLTATWNGETSTRTTQNPYKFAAVVNYWDAETNKLGNGIIASWHKTAEAASKGVLTSQQKKAGLKVIAVVPVEWPEGLSEPDDILDSDIPAPAGKYNLANIKKAVIDPAITPQTVLFQEGPLELRSSFVYGQVHLKYTHADGTYEDQFHDPLTWTDATIDQIVADILDAKTTADVTAAAEKAAADNSALLAKAAVPEALKAKKMTADVFIGKTSTTYTHGQVIAESLGGNERIIWNGKIKKFQTQAKSPSGVWINTASYNKQAAHKLFGGKFGWYEPAQSYDTAGGYPGDAITPSVAGNPVPVHHSTQGQTGTKTPFTADELQSQPSVQILTPSEAEILYKKFRNALGPGKTTLTTSPPDQIFLSAAVAQMEHNKKNPGSPISLLQALNAVDERGAAAAGVADKHLYRSAVIVWLKTPDGMKQASKLLEDAQNMDALLAKAAADAAKAAAEMSAAQAVSTAMHLAEMKKNASASWKTVQSIPISKPAPKPGDTHKPITDAEAQALQNQMVPGGINGLPEEQKAAIQSYKYGSGSVNGFLRAFGTSSNSSSTVSQVTEIQKGMRPIPKPILLYRGVGTLFDESFKPTVEELNAMAGKRMTEFGFSSSSIDPGVFSNSYRLNIQVPAGTPAMYVQHLGVKSHQGEKEWILAAGLHFEIIDAVKVGYKILVNVKVVP